MTFAQTLNRRVSLQRAAGRDAIGQPLPGFVEFGTAWANIRHTGGLEAIKAGAVTSKVQASIRLRYRTDLDAAVQVVYGTAVYKVLAVLPDAAARVHVDLVCEVVK